MDTSINSFKIRRDSICKFSFSLNFSHSYGAGFIFTTALPPDKISAALTSLDILKNEEGRMLRQRHQENVKKLRNKLLRMGLPVENCTSHIVPVQVRIVCLYASYLVSKAACKINSNVGASEKIKMTK